MNTFDGYRRGINLGGWFSQCDHSPERYDHFIVKEDLEKIAGLGFDHVRLPIDYELLLNGDGSYREEGFVYIERCLSWCREYGLSLVIDLHKTPGFSFDAGEHEDGFFEKEGYQKTFFDLWAKLALRFGNEKNLCFELLNEVSEKRYAKTWNRIAGEAIAVIRNYSPKVPILVGGYHNNSIEALPDLELPADENIVYNFHFYAPLVFTHQGAYWIDKMNEDFRMEFHSSYAQYKENTKKFIGEDFDDHFPQGEGIMDVAYFDELFKKAAAIAQERGVALYCGEFGVIDRADPLETLKWYECMGKMFEKYGISRCLWSYKEMDFGLIGPHYDTIRERILELI
ncbi:MAG: glycoside hydrolase family 5 protein [Erysipelotrichaceae bacterium]|nr:glycoside hydrolase family 5 protein [Erysipelotrichaceae bacterium]